MTFFFLITIHLELWILIITTTIKLILTKITKKQYYVHNRVYEHLNAK